MEAIKEEMRIQSSKIWEFLNDQSIRIPEIVIYTEENFCGKEFRTNCDISYVGIDFNNKIKSIVVVSGIWEFYKDAEFRIGNLKDKKSSKLLKPGYYNGWITQDNDLNINDISSFRCIIP